jgi:hypothetical protein
MAYRHTNSRGITYYLNAKKVTLRGGKSQTIYYFSKDERRDTGVDLPDDRTVNEAPGNGFLTLKPKGSAPVSEQPPLVEDGGDVELALTFTPQGLGLTLSDEIEVERTEAPDGAVYEVSPVYVASLSGSESCIERLERLVRTSSSEAALQECLEDCPELVRIFGHRDALPHVILETPQQTLIPDFILRPVAHDLCDLLEIKTPSMPILTGTERRPLLTRRLASALAQLHDYAEALDDPVVRSRVATRYEIDFFRPRLYLIAGRAEGLDQRRLRRALGSDDRTDIISWDEVIARARHLGA